MINWRYAVPHYRMLKYQIKNGGQEALCCWLCDNVFVERHDK